MGHNERIFSVEDISHRGVSGATLKKGVYVRGGLSIPIIIKEGSDIYKGEVAGARILRDHIPIIEPFDYIDDNTAIYPLIGNARSLNDILTDPDQIIEGNQLLEQYLRMHINMWNSTYYYHHKNYIGYSKKTEKTQKDVLQKTIGKCHLWENEDKPLSIKLIQNEQVTDPIHKNFEVGSMADSIDWMNNTLEDSIKLGVCLTHGDEGFGNCLVRDPNAVGVNYTNPLVMIDLNGAGYRSPFESIAKISSWLPATQVEQISYSYGSTPDLAGMKLVVNYSLPKNYLDIEKAIPEYCFKKLEFFKGKDEDMLQNYLNAYQMMYFLREATYYADNRERSGVVPYLIGRSFSFAPKS